MAAFNYTQPPDATGEQLTHRGPNARFEIYPNFNGQAGIPYNGNFVISDARDTSTGVLWTAHYGIAGPNTITIQFASPLQSASTTAADYTLSGPTAPSISSVAFSVGGRNIQLNLSGALVSTNTYTLGIGSNKVLTGTKVAYSQPKWGVYNWPGLVVDVIQPTTISSIGVGVQQDIALGSPSMNTVGSAQGVGFEQAVALGSPEVDTLASTIGIGVEQTVSIGLPVMAAGATATSVGIAQSIALGLPFLAQEQQPVGVGFEQTIVLGSPVATTNPLTPVGESIAQVVALGVPVASGPANVIGMGIDQTISFGLPVAARIFDQGIDGVGFEQTIAVGQAPVTDLDNISVSGGAIAQEVSVGTPNVGSVTQTSGVGIEQTVALGSPVMNISVLTPTGVGIVQSIDVGLPSSVIDQATMGAGIEQTIDVGSPEIDQPLNSTSVGIAQAIDVGTPTIPALIATATAVGIQQDLLSGTPTVTGDGFFIHTGFEQTIDVGTPVVAYPLRVTDAQEAALINLDIALHKAFGEGVAGAINADLIDPIDDYIDNFTSLQRDQTRTIFKDVGAAAMVSLNIPGLLPNTNNNDSALLAKVATPGLSGSLSFVDGVLVSKVEPTGSLECIGVGIEQFIDAGTPNSSN